MTLNPISKTKVGDKKGDPHYFIRRAVPILINPRGPPALRIVSIDLPLVHPATAAVEVSPELGIGARGAEPLFAEPS